MLQTEYAMTTIGFDKAESKFGVTSPPGCVTRAVHLTVTIPGFLPYSPVIACIILCSGLPLVKLLEITNDAHGKIISL